MIESTETSATSSAVRKRSGRRRETNHRELGQKLFLSLSSIFQCIYKVRTMHSFSPVHRSLCCRFQLMKCMVVSLCTRCHLDSSSLDVLYCYVVIARCVWNSGRRLIPCMRIYAFMIYFTYVLAQRRQLIELVSRFLSLKRTLSLRARASPLRNFRALLAGIHSRARFLLSLNIFFLRGG